MALDGKLKHGSAGAWDTYIILANRYQWPDTITAQCDPDFIAELMERIAAEGELEREREKKQSRAQKHNKYRHMHQMG
jgi:hypothetical protein